MAPLLDRDLDLKLLRSPWKQQDMILYSAVTQELAPILGGGTLHFVEAGHCDVACVGSAPSWVKEVLALRAGVKHGKRFVVDKATSTTTWASTRLQRIDTRYMKFAATLAAGEVSLKVQTTDMGHSLQRLWWHPRDLQDLYLIVDTPCSLSKGASE